MNSSDLSELLGQKSVTSDQTSSLCRPGTWLKQMRNHGCRAGTGSFCAQSESARAVRIFYELESELEQIIRIFFFLVSPFMPAKLSQRGLIILQGARVNEDVIQSLVWHWSVNNFWSEIQRIGGFGSGPNFSKVQIHAKLKVGEGRARWGC